ncbi:MAG: chemotaxis response regulator protein-glutamate methylesterase [Isosphaeraceae bacterium]
MSRSDSKDAQPGGGNPARIRVLVVDDSALMRKLLADLLATSPEVEVVGMARDGEDALAQTARLRPDVITLDVEMPGRSGIEILPQLLATHDAAVVMVSSLTKEGADVTFAALERGAVDFLPKPDRNQFAQMREAADLLVSKVLSAAQSHRPKRKRSESSASGRRAAPAGSSSSTLTPVPAAPSAPELSCPTPSTSIRCIVVGISTGGPQALGAVLPLLTPPLPPILIVQHMPAPFTGVFAERLNRSCAIPVKEAEEGDRLAPDRMFVAPGGRQMSIAGRAATARITITDDPPVSGHRPSVDVLFASAARVFQAATLGLILTGMGRDGVEGCKLIRSAGGLTFGQDEATSAVYGMNKVAFLEHALDGQFALNQLPALVKKLCAER